MLGASPVGVSPVAVAVGLGKVWVADVGDGTVAPIDMTARAPTPRGDRSGRGAPVAIAAGAYGGWRAEPGQSYNIDPATRRVVGAPVRVDPAGIATGDGAIWVTSRRADRLTRIDPSAPGAAPVSIPVGSQPTALAVDSGGVWVADSADGRVTRVDPRTRRADPPIRVCTAPTPRVGARQGSHEEPGAEVLDLAVGDGTVWVARTNSVETRHIEILRIDSASHKVTGRPIRVSGGIPLRLAVTPGTVWATDVGSPLPGAAGRPAAVLRISVREGARGSGRPCCSAPRRSPPNPARCG